MARLKRKNTYTRIAESITKVKYLKRGTVTYRVQKVIKNKKISRNFKTLKEAKKFLASLTAPRKGSKKKASSRRKRR